uniref:TIGR04283 family arsenosugar biosynthesis glycosyltransferase n=1 Tax=Trichocoleus desertorum TaxID=1481672 RepID=UPI0025B2E6D1|nr:TIGR04283 family arsenosugar biosynthesis glycosyltransferase [Trichocoleus desertorum]
MATAVRERLIIFTRYPEPGKTKTRLIPALGPERAAILQQRMTEHTLAQAQLLQASSAIALEVRFTGGDRYLMRSWLGTELAHRSQGEGNLGQRMTQAFQSAFRAGMQRVVIIGIDCPDLDAIILSKAFQELQQHDLVLGPATDGGYYLIGLRRFVPELFQDIAWSTDRVWQQTIAIAQQHHLSVGSLPPLDDVDRPEDLAIWERVSQSSIDQIGNEKISIIIPVLNEAAAIAQTLAAAQQTSQAEIIVVDGGSQDDTVAIAQSAGAKVIMSAPGRAQQMNAGAKVAAGEVLLFLHGDTLLPPEFATQIRQALISPGVIAGAFALKIDSAVPGIRLMERLVNWRSRSLQMPYGDQAIFLRAKTFHSVGGFADLPIMEDFELMRQLKKKGAIAIVSEPVITSGRRWERLGLLRTTLINQAVILAYFLGVSRDRLARWYRSH